MQTNGNLDVASVDKGPPHVLGGSCCPLGTRGGEKLANSALSDWDMAPNIAGNITRASRPRNTSPWHLCDIFIAHNEFSTVVAGRL